MKGEGRNGELVECAMRRGVSVRAYEAAEGETASGWVGKKPASFSPKKGRKSTSFRSIPPCSPKNKIFSRERFDYSKLKSYFCA